MAHPFPFIGAGVACARKTMDVLVVFARNIPAKQRKAISKGLPRSLDHTTWDRDGVIVSHNGDSLQWVVCAEFADADPDYFGEYASDAQWEAFNAAFEAWLLATHRTTPIAVVIRPIDEEYGTATSDWHDWSVANKASIDRAKLPEWAVAEIDAARATPKPPAKPAAKAKPAATARPFDDAKLRDAIWNVSYMPDPLVDAMSYHRKRGEPEHEAAAFWFGLLYLRVMAGAVPREVSKAIGRPPPDAHDRVSRWLKLWLAPKLEQVKKLPLAEVRRWLRWCCDIQSAVLDDWHELLEREVLRRAHPGKLVTRQGFCPICGKTMEVAYVGSLLVTARCTATNARMQMNAGDFLHRNMFDTMPTATSFNAMSALEPDWFCARCGAKHKSRKDRDGMYTVQLGCPKCKHGYTSGLLDGVYKSMHDRHYRKSG